jgi:hypothetical protein
MTTVISIIAGIQAALILFFVATAINSCRNERRATDHLLPGEEAR